LAVKRNIVSTSGVSNKLPNASGSFPAANFTRCSPGELNVPKTGSARLPEPSHGASFALAAGPKTSFATRADPALTALFPPPRVRSPAARPRANADFTIEISGSGGTNGFFKTHPAHALRSCSSMGSNAPPAKSPECVPRVRSSFTTCKPVPLRTGNNTSAKPGQGEYRISFEPRFTVADATTSMP